MPVNNVTYYYTLPPTAAAVEEPKSGQVDMSAQLASMLTQLRSLRCEVALAGGDGELGPWVFATPVGSPLDESAVRKAMRRVLKRASLPEHFTPHCLRHTFATLMIQRGVPLAYIKEQLGHSSIKVTVDSYGRWLPSGESGLMDKLDDPGFTDGDQMVTESSFEEERIPQVVGSKWSRREDLNLRPADYESSSDETEESQQNQKHSKQRKSTHSA